MLVNKEVATAAAALVLAASIGFAMQSTETAKVRYGVQTTPAATAADPQEVPLQEASLSGLKSIELTSAPTGFEGLRSSVRPMIRHDARAMATPGCAISASADAKPGAIIGAELHAPCFQNARMTVHHNGMRFSAVTDNAGRAAFDIPALVREAVVIFDFPDGYGAVARADVPAIVDYDRSVLQWEGTPELRLHANALEKSRGLLDYLWATDTPALETEIESAAFRLGNASLLDGAHAEVYTFPAHITQSNASVELSVEAHVTQNNCNREVEAQIIELDGGDLRAREILLTMPGCDAVGRTLLLNNSATDLKVAVK